MTDPIYTARGISKRFGPNWVLRDVNLDIRPGETLGLIGSNGAGKSTLLKILAGSLLADQGELVLDGKPVRMMSMQEAWRNGIAFVSQELSLFPALTVAENLALVPRRSRSFANGKFRNKATASLEMLGLNAALSSRLGSLSLADQQLVEIARALLQNPRVLILDEPTSALHAAEADRLHGVLRQLRASGVAIIYISHFLEEVIDISDSIVILRDGRRVSYEGSDIPSLDAVVAAMLGERSAETPEAKYENPTSTRSRGSLRIRNLVGPVGLNLEFLNVESGEVVGVAGLAGAGVEELFALLFGRISPVSGTIELPGGQRQISDTAAAVANGVAYLPADRKRLGLTLAQTIRENVVSVRELALARGGFVLHQPRQAERAERRCRAINVKMTSVEQQVSSLSGGNQQKVVFAKWMEADPFVLLLDDPMRGVDIGAKREMYRIIRELAGDGRLVLFYSSDPADYIAVADRVLVFANGALHQEISREHLSEHSLVASINTGLV